MSNTQIQKANQAEISPSPTTIASMLQQVIDRADSINPESFVGAIERLAKIQADMFDRDDRIRFREAMTAFKAEMPKVVRTRPISDRNGKEMYKVTALEDVADPVMKSLLKHGITYRYKSDVMPDGKIKVTCYLSLEGTAYEEQGSSLAAPPDTSGGKDALKAVGSTTSYLEKYTLMASVGMHVYGSDPESIPQQLDECMEEGAVADFLSSIEGAADLDELSHAFRAAMKACGVPDSVLDHKGDLIGAAQYKSEARQFVDARQKAIRRRLKGMRC